MTKPLSLMTTRNSQAQAHYYCSSEDDRVLAQILYRFGAPCRKV
jgi:hypothetical protein